VQEFSTFEHTAFANRHNEASLVLSIGSSCSWRRMLSRFGRRSLLLRTRPRRSALYSSAADDLSSSLTAARSLLGKLKIETPKKPSSPPAPKKRLEIIDEEEEPMFPLKPQEKTVKKRSTAPKKVTPKVPQVIYPDNVDLEISEQIKKAVSKKGKATNPQVRDPEEEEDDAIGAVHDNFNEHITKVRINIFDSHHIKPRFFFRW
jgi:hypothetical protein